MKLLLLACTVLGWNSETHLLTARIAYDILSKENPSALQAAEDLLDKFSDYSSAKHEDKYKFVECVTWPDDIKRIGGGW
jgi:hypothetical protein